MNKPLGRLTKIKRRHKSQVSAVKLVISPIHSNKGNKVILQTALCSSIQHRRNDPIPWITND